MFTQIKTGINKGEKETVDAVAAYLEREGDTETASSLRGAWLEQLTPEEVRAELARLGPGGLVGMPEEAARSVRGIIALVRRFPQIAQMVLLRAKVLAQVEEGQLDNAQASPGQ